REVQLVLRLAAGRIVDADDAEASVNAAAQRDPARDPGAGDLSCLAAEPALFPEIAGKLLIDRASRGTIAQEGVYGAVLAFDLDDCRHSSSSRRSSNQKKSCGPKVRRYGSSPIRGNAF